MVKGGSLSRRHNNLIKIGVSLLPSYLTKPHLVLVHQVTLHLTTHIIHIVQVAQIAQLISHLISHLIGKLIAYLIGHLISHLISYWIVTLVYLF